MAKADVSIRVADLPQVKGLLERASWRIECLETMLLHASCTQCGCAWTGPACGPTHVAIASQHPTLLDRGEQ